LRLFHLSDAIISLVGTFGDYQATSAIARLVGGHRLRRAASIHQPILYGYTAWAQGVLSERRYFFPHTDMQRFGFVFESRPDHFDRDAGPLAKTARQGNRGLRFPGDWPITSRQALLGEAIDDGGRLPAPVDRARAHSRTVSAEE